MLLDIINSISNTQSTNHKIAILDKNKDTHYLFKLLEYTYDKVKFTYGISTKIVEELKTVQVRKELNNLNLDGMFEMLDILNNNEFNNKIKSNVKAFIHRNSQDTKDILLAVLERSLLKGMSVKNISKVYKNFGSKPPYQRCTAWKDELFDKITRPFYAQLKVDGAFMYYDPANNNFISRSGKIYKIPSLSSIISQVLDNDFILVGELVVKNNGNYIKREISNGIVSKVLANTANDDEIESLHFAYYDIIRRKDFESRSSNQSYEVRFFNLKSLNFNSEKVYMVDTYLLESKEEVTKIFSSVTESGLEGLVIKDRKAVWKDTKSNTYLKMKVEKDCELRIVGFTEGKDKYTGMLGAFCCQSECGNLKVDIGTGLSDEQRKDYWLTRDKLIGKIVTVTYNEVTKCKGLYSLFLPRFKMIRGDKEIADNLNCVEMEICQKQPHLPV